MTAADPRCLDMVELTTSQVAALLSPLLSGRPPASVEPARDGLTNTVYRVVAADGGTVFGLRTTHDVATTRTDGNGSHQDGAETLLATTEALLAHPHCHQRLGPDLARALSLRLAEVAPRLHSLGPASRLVHGDLGGRNILIGPGKRGHEIAALIDWESAHAGWPLWDVGSLFRYSRRYSTPFRDEFEYGYRAAGGWLPNDWWRTARLLDATRLVRLVSGPRELPVATAEARDLLRLVVDDG